MTKKVLNDAPLEERFPKLALPPLAVPIEERSCGHYYLYDTLRRRWLLLTPEEWVRQHFVHYLVHYRGYPPHAVANEVAVPNLIRKGRTDTIIFGSGGKRWALIEYKAAHLKLGAKMWEQLVAYNLNCQVDLVCLTNGIQQVICLLDDKRGPTFLNEFPTFEELKTIYSEKRTDEAYAVASSTSHTNE